MHPAPRELDVIATKLSEVMPHERADLERLADLLRRHNAIGDEIAQVIGRPAERGHVGEYVASRIFGIALEGSARKRAQDGRFISGPLADRTVNVKWYGKQESVLDLHARRPPDYYLALTGPAGTAASSRGATRPWVIRSVYLFDAPRLLADLRARGVRIRAGSSVRQALWTAAEVYPEPRNAALVLSQEQCDLLAFFG
ncbi:MAG TPA: hypothetical protein VFW01_06685 [bacterium]|nr:hypothetical protein [bacterium]